MQTVHIHKIREIENFQDSKNTLLPLSLILRKANGYILTYWTFTFKKLYKMQLILKNIISQFVLLQNIEVL